MLLEFTRRPYHPLPKDCPRGSPKNGHFSNAIIPLLEGPVAQLVEQRIENPRVDGSIPSQATNPNPSNRNVARVFYLKPTVEGAGFLIFQLEFSGSDFFPKMTAASSRQEIIKEAAGDRLLFLLHNTPAGRTSFGSVSGKTASLSAAS